GRLPVGTMRATGLSCGTNGSSRPQRTSCQSSQAAADRSRPGGGHMRIRSIGLTLFSGLAILVAACGPAATPSATTATTAPVASTPADSTAPSTEPSVAPSAPAQSNLKIGVVTDIGTLNDKNYNEYSFKGAEEGAAAIGAAEPVSIVPTAASEYAPSIKSFVD